MYQKLSSLIKDNKVNLKQDRRNKQRNNWEISLNLNITQPKGSRVVIISNQWNSSTNSPGFNKWKSVKTIWKISVKILERKLINLFKLL